MIAARSSQLVQVGGSVCEVSSTSCKIAGLSRIARLGDCVATQTSDGEQLAEVVHVDDTGILVKPFQNDLAVGLGARSWYRGRITVAPHASWKGRVVNALGEPIDGAGPLAMGTPRDPKNVRPPAPMQRQRITRPVRTGINAVDLFSPLCAGQRIGIFAGSGIGKSTLLAMLARTDGFDTIVLGMVGERGREVREFLEDGLSGTRNRTVAVVSSGDESPMMRKLAPLTATATAEFFRDRGETVLLIIDSITRFAHAAREVALAAGEPPVARGYAPSVFSELPMLLERAGTSEDGDGAITGIYSVLVDGDDHNEPVADCIRGTLDGHIVLSRAIAEQGRYPAIDILASVSRLSNQVWTADQAKLVLTLRGLISRFEDTRDLRLLGGYHAGADHELDKAVELTPKIYAHLAQDDNAPCETDPFESLAAVLAG
ncbi:MAG: FliI/YscN family ATPase [Aestuariivirgaceae bacterium]